MTDKLAVIYARYSDSKQTEQSIEGQIKKCNEYAERNHYTIIKEYIDRAQTGKTDDRFFFQKMLKDSENKQFDTVIVYAINRFGRNTRQSLNNAYLLESNDITILSATQEFANNPSGKLYRTMVMANDQYYSDELAEKTARGMEINADKCYSNGGTVPLGYRLEKIDPKDDKSKKKYVIDEEAAPIVQEIFTKYADGWSIKAICDNLNERQLKSSTGVAFNKNSLHTMLKNRKYLGVYIYKGVEHEGGMPQIIDQDLFGKVAEKMTVNKKLPARSRAIVDYLLTGKLFCGYCKAMMIGHSSNKVSKGGVKYSYYRCKNQGGGKPCKKKMAHKDYIENIVVDKCRELLSPQNIRRIAKEIMKVAENYDDKTEVHRLEGLLQEAEEGKTSYLAALRACKDDKVREMIFEDLGRVGSQIDELKKQLKIENARRQTITEKKVIDTLSKLAVGDANNMVYRKALVRLLVNKIFLYDDKFTITFNTGDDEVEITDGLLSKIEENLEGKAFCVFNGRGHHREQIRT